MAARKKPQPRPAAPPATPAAALPATREGLPKPLLWTSGAALLFLYLTLTVLSSRNKSPSYDEPAHITAGYTYWAQGDFRLNPENGNLPQRIAALPLMLAGVRFPALTGASWEKSDVWRLADQFLFQLGNDASSLLLRSRVAVALLGVALGLTVFCWSRRLFGDAGGLLSLLLYSLCPVMLAHGQMATSDMSAALFFTLTVRAMWQTLERVTPGRIAISSLAMAGLFLSKFTAVLVFPIALLLVLAHYRVHRRLVVAWRWQEWLTRTAAQWLGAIAVIVAVHGLIVWVLVWAAFGFRYEAAAHGQRQEFYKYPTLARNCERAGGVAGPAIAWLGRQRLLPEAYLYGAAYTVTHSNRFSFFNGDYSIAGWRQYFPFCLAVKTPLALFGLLAAATLAIGLRPRSETMSELELLRRRETLVQCVPLIVLLGVYWGTAILSTLNIGHRHLLPTYPAMYILAGGAASWLTRSRMASVFIGLLVVAFMAESARAFPHYLAYFNLLIPRGQAYRSLVDSNLDWGQDLPGLKQWLDAQEATAGRQPVYLRYFGSVKPEYYGIRAQELPIRDPQAGLYPMRGGIYCISATELQAVYLPIAGRWNASYERVYQALAAWLPGRSNVPSSPPMTPADEQLQSVRDKFPDMQLARLLAYLRQREPDAQIGYSILIYHLTDEDVQQATQGPPAELDELSWREKERLRGTWD